MITVRACKAQVKRTSPTRRYEVTKTEAEWRKQLSPIQFDVTRKKGTETPYSGFIGITTLQVLIIVFVADSHSSLQLPNSTVVQAGPVSGNRSTVKCGRTGRWQLWYGSYQKWTAVAAGLTWAMFSMMAPTHRPQVLYEFSLTEIYKEVSWPVFYCCNHQLTWVNCTKWKVIHKHPSPSVGYTGSTFPSHDHDMERIAHLLGQWCLQAWLGRPNRSEVFPDSFNKALNIPFRLAEGMSIHFVFMWLFAINGSFIFIPGFSGGGSSLPQQNSLKDHGS